MSDGPALGVAQDAVAAHLRVGARSLSIAIVATALSGYSNSYTATFRVAETLWSSRYW